MSVNFRREGIEANQWRPIVCGVDFGDRFDAHLAALQDAGADMWTAWADMEESDAGPAVSIQITQDIARVVLSGLDDDSDAILIEDPRDEKYFRFMRLGHPDIFPRVHELVAPWAICIASLVPQETHYKPILGQLEIPDSIPEDFA